MSEIAISEMEIRKIAPSQDANNKKKSYKKKVESEWSQEDSYKLIKEVEARRVLWDAGCEEYRLPKPDEWQEIANALGRDSVNDCKGKWTNLRTTFKRKVAEIRIKKSGQGTDESYKTNWPYFKMMQFLEVNDELQATVSISSMQLVSYFVESH